MFALLLGFMFLQLGVRSQLVTLDSVQFHTLQSVTTFTYSLTATSVNYWVLGLENCPQISVQSTVPSVGGLDLKRDEQTQISGITWFGKVSHYKISVHGHVKRGPTSYAIVTGAYKSVTGVVDGPICSYYDDVVCDAGGPYLGDCANNQLNVHLLGHNSLHAVSYSWSAMIPGAQLLNPDSVSTVLKLPVTVCKAAYKVYLRVVGHDPSDIRDCFAWVIIEDKEKPIIHNIYEQDVSAEPHDIPAPMLLSATDNCDLEVQIKFREYSVENNHPCSYILVRTWEAHDDCGNTAFHSQQISVTDTTDPILTGVEPGGAYDCDAVPPPCTVEGSDYNEVTVVIKENKIPGPCDCTYTLTRKWIATDCAGNVAQKTQIITVSDTEPPKLFGIPENITVACDQIPDIPTPSATDNCCGATISYFDNIAKGTCVHEYVISRTWTVRDACGNKDSATQLISVEDKEAPAMTGVGDDLTVQCDEIPLPCEVEVKDDCDPVVHVTFDDTKGTDSSCEHEYDLLYTWTTEDACGNQNAEDQTISVVDDTPPSLSGTPPHDLTVECDSIPVFTVKAHDNCDSSVVSPVIGTDRRISTLYGNDYVDEWTWHVEDDCGNSNEWVSTVTVQDNDDPVLIGVPDDIHTTCDSIPDKADVEATDNCCDDYLIPVLDYNQTKQLGTCDQSYTLTRTWIAHDCSHNSKQKSQQITVEDNQAPVLYGLPGYLVVPCYGPFPNVTVTANDTCDDNPVLVPSEIIRPGSCKTQKKRLRKWVAHDNCGNYVSYTQTIVSYDDEAPVITNVPADRTFDCVLGFPLQNPDVTDVCDVYLTVKNTTTKKLGSCEYDITYYRSWFVADDCGNSATADQKITVWDKEAPKWGSTVEEKFTSEYPNEPDPPQPNATDNCDYAPAITFNERKLQFGYLCHKAYRLIRAWFLIDRCGNVGPVLTQDIIVDDTAHPNFTSSPEDTTVECDDIPPPHPVHAIDHYEEIDVTMTELTLFGSCNYDYDIRRIWLATDSCGNADSQEQLISVQDTEPPEFKTVPENITAECNAPPPVTPVADDNCDGYLDVVLIYDNTTVNTMSYGTAMKTVYRLWKATDSCGNFAHVSQEIQVYDTKYPYFVNVAHDATVECDEDHFTLPKLIATDDCDPNPTKFYIGNSVGAGTCEELKIRTWSVQDHVGHLTDYVQTITVVDNTPPVLNGYIDSNINVECDNIPPETPLTAKDNCDEDVTVTSTNTTINISDCPSRYILFRTWIAEDDCGNKATYQKTINVDDTEPPVLYCNASVCVEYDAGFEIECDDPFLDTVLTVTAEDNCDPLKNITGLHDTERGTCDDAYLRISTYVAEDNCGNQVTHERTITVVDTTPPFWTGVLPNTTVSVPYHEQPACPLLNLTAEDECDDDVSISCADVNVPGICEQDYTLTCTCTAVDDCGNSVSFIQVISVFDDEPPTIKQANNDTIECLNNVLPPSTPQVDWGYSEGTLSVTQRPLVGSCEESIIYTWLAIDACKLNDIMEYTVFVEDNHAPDIFNVPADETVQCHPPPKVGYLGGEDNCDGKVIVLYDQQKILVNGPYCYTLVRTWSAYDHCGHQAFESQTITVNDTQPPVVSYPPHSITTDCHSLPFADESDISVTDNCEEHRDVNFTDVRDPGTCDCDYKQYRSWEACDSCGNCVSVFSTVVVQDTTPPALSMCPGDVTVQTGDVPYSHDVVGSDTYGAEVDVTFNEDRHNSTYSIGAGYLYMLFRHWSAQDDCGNFVDCEQTVTVIDTIPVPVVGVPHDIVLPCIEPGDIDAIYQTDAITAVVTANVIAANGGTIGDIEVIVSVNVTDEGTCISEYVWRRCWETTDHSQNTEEACFTITVVDTQPPHFTTFPEVDFAECEADPLDENSATAIDNCWTNATVTYDPDSQLSAYAGYVASTWTATDACGYTAVITQTTWVSDTEPPIWNNPPSSTTVCCDDVPTEPEPNATDACNHTVSYHTSSWREEICEGEYIIYYEWRASDSQGNWIPHTWQVSVEDCAPPILYAGSAVTYNNSTSELLNESSLHNDTEVECPWTEIHHSVYAKDECNEYAWNVPLYSINRWGNDCERYVAFHWETADDCGREASYTQTVKIVDTQAPVLHSCPTPLTINATCNTPLPSPYVYGADVCDPDIDVHRSDEVIPGSCDYTYAVLITWSIRDRCNFEDSCNQTVLFDDLEDPVLTLHEPGNRTVDCDVMLEKPSVSASDDCQDYFNIEFDEDRIDGTCPCEYSLNRTWSTTDKCGKTASVTQTITVIDRVAPKLSNKPKDVTVPCLHIPPEPPMSGSDNCCEVTVVFTETNGTDATCDDGYDVYRKWEVTDECGLTAQYEYTITVVDLEPPYFPFGFNIVPFIKVECDPIDPPQIVLTAEDVCDESPVVTPTNFTHPGSCLDSFYIFYYWDADDACGNTVQLKQTIQVIDTTPPTLVLPEEESYECDDIPNANNHNLTATDNCDPNPHMIFQSHILGADCSDNWSVMMVWTVEDRCGNEAIFSLVVGVDDTEYPVLNNVPNDTTVNCTVPPQPFVTVDDNCDKLLTANFAQDMLYGECEHGYTVIRRWSATDRCQNTVYEEQTITVVDNGTPTLHGVPDNITIPCKDHQIAAHVTATDECDKGVSVVFSEELIPGSCPFQYVTVFTWTAEDDCGHVVVDSQTITVHDNSTPTLSVPDCPDTAPCDSIPLPPVMFATDGCTYSLNIKYTESRIDGSCDNDYIILRVWSVADECGNKVTEDCSITVDDDTPPVFIGKIPANRSDDCDDISLQPTFGTYDDCGGYVKYEEGEEHINGSCPHEYQLRRWYTAEDSCGNSVSDEYYVDVVDNDSPVFLTKPGDTTLECHEDLPYAKLEATDNCGYDVTVTPADEVTLPLSCEEEYTSIREWTAVDACGLEDVHVQTVTYEDTTPPVLNEHEDITTEIGNIPPPWNCSWTDNCDEDGNKPFTREVKPGSCVHAFRFKYTCEAEDCNGNTATTTHYVHVFDFTPPVIVGVGADVTVIYQHFPELKFAKNGVTVTDNSDSPGEFSYIMDNRNLSVSDRRINGYDANDYVIIRTYTAIDLCKNKAVKKQTITVIDETPPCFDEEPDDITVECDAIPEPCDVYTVGEELNVAFYEATSAFGAYDSIIKRHWEAFDHSGNSATHTQSITVVDTTPPVFTREPDDTTYDCDCEGFPAMANLAAVDNCDDYVHVTSEETVSEEICADEYTLLRTWTATDHAGIPTAYTQTISIVDNDDPVFSVKPDDYTLECDELSWNNPLDKVSYHDNCDDDLTVVYNASFDVQELANCTVVTTHFISVEDICGNSANHSWTQTVVDNTPPTVTGSKQCVYTRTDDGSYGSSTDIYKRYKLKDLVQYHDNCYTNLTDVSAVWFNRSTNDDTNLVNKINVEDYFGDKHMEVYADTVVGQQYLLTFGAMQPVDVKRVPPAEFLHEQTVQVGNKEGGSAMYEKTVSPGITPLEFDSQPFCDFKMYSLHFTARSDETKILFPFDLLWLDAEVLSYTTPGRICSEAYNPSFYPTVKTFYGDGRWMVDEHPSTTSRDEVIGNCVAGPTKLTDLVSPCNKVLYGTDGEVFVALPVMKNDRYCYRSMDRSWRSLDSYSHENVNYWILTNYSPRNPSAYSWLTYEGEIKKGIDRGTPFTQILEALVQSNTIEVYWMEENLNSPHVTQSPSLKVDCDSLNDVSEGQCQGACYYKGYSTAILYGTADLEGSSCQCARQCSLNPLPGVGRYFNVFKWFEGYYYDPEADYVYVLAIVDEDQDDLYVNMWVTVSDPCGHSAITSVEFWIAPSLEDAAAQGRVCDHPDHFPSEEYDKHFAFTSGVVLVPDSFTEDHSGLVSFAGLNQEIINDNLEPVQDSGGINPGGFGSGEFNPGGAPPPQPNIGNQQSPNFGSQEAPNNGF